MYVHGLMQERSNSSALALQLHFSCTNPLILSGKKLECAAFSEKIIVPFNIYLHQMAIVMFSLLLVCLFVLAMYSFVVFHGDIMKSHHEF